jgi:hypothetical protein
LSINMSLFLSILTLNPLDSPSNRIGENNGLNLDVRIGSID